MKKPIFNFSIKPEQEYIVKTTNKEFPFNSLKAAQHKHLSFVDFGIRSQLFLKNKNGSLEEIKLVAALPGVIRAAI